MLPAERTVVTDLHRLQPVPRDCQRHAQCIPNAESAKLQFRHNQYSWYYPTGDRIRGGGDIGSDGIGGFVVVLLEVVTILVVVVLVALRILLVSVELLLVVVILMILVVYHHHDGTVVVFLMLELVMILWWYF